MNAYCLFCNTMKRDEIAGAIERSRGYHVIAPKIIQRKWVKGTPCDVEHDYLPGYLFIYSEAPIEDFIALMRMGDVYRILGDRDSGHRLSGSDLAFAEMLLKCNGVLGAVKAYKVGDRVKLAEGALGGVNGEIVKLDRRGRALIQFSFDGVVYNTWVGYELIDQGPLVPDPEPEDP